MEIFLPTLEEKMVTLVGVFRFIVFAIMVVGLIAFASSPRTGSTALLAGLAKAIVIVAARLITALRSRPWKARRTEKARKPITGAAQYSRW